MGIGASGSSGGTGGWLGGGGGTICIHRHSGITASFSGALSPVNGLPGDWFIFLRSGAPIVPRL
jgi:hypothetical protein